MCNCSFNNGTICHVTSIMLLGLEHNGVLPAEFGYLPYLQDMYFLSNNFSGGIPETFGNLKNLIGLFLNDNQLEGALPDSLGNLSSLQIMDLSSNNFSGSIPDTFGNLKNLTELYLDNNQLRGALPDSLGNLSSLRIMILSSNNLRGSIPETFGNLKSLKKLCIQGTEMEGPFPSNISLLRNLSELMISDLNGSSMAFPNLQGLKQLYVLVLRNCLLTGTIPEYIGNMTKMSILDLSFNKLTGEIPDAIENLQSLKYMFLTSNSLNGSVPSWLVHRKKNFDVSFNNFTGLPTTNCQPSNVSLVSSFPLTTSNVNSWCFMKDLPCPKKPEYYSLFINCGGEAMNYDGNDYDEDFNPLGPSYFAFSDSTKWAYSSTGVFSQYDDNADFIASNPYNLNVTSIYQTARLSPLSLRYYGLCLRKGSYRVQLHFAEIMYSNNQSSIGRRIFNVYIQGNLMLKDFNIMENASGVGKGITINFTDIIVNSSTLEISLYWAGKGTTDIPQRGVYGPLISAITITSNFSTLTGYSIGAVAGIITASCVILASLLLFLWMKGYLGRKSKGDEAFQGLVTSYFSLSQIKAATDDFNPINKIGEGGFGPVYKGVLADGKMIAIKQLSSKSKQGNREFVNEIGLISGLQHPNLVKLYGCCIEGKELLLIYEYMENNSLARALFGRELSWLNLDWPTRKRICLGIARGLAYLHEESRLKIVHRDIKATNILLDKDLNAKISDFGLAKLDEDENTHISTRIAGTVGYMAPDFPFFPIRNTSPNCHGFWPFMISPGLVLPLSSTHNSIAVID
ncbi:hypothetical protein Nepgr_027758 [Nepenthes gracilis]|uniref:non-specific serine/threonine protein kinase n=1 Tax=Nepenthes gracilis TaxID=150966 RepID=A0AAD3TAD7_NEPGR|nr:hypothetical protein Nepgr_027758 [Nepenthes gracilis]